MKAMRLSTAVFAVVGLVSAVRLHKQEDALAQVQQT